jgi:pyruvate kinase
MNNKDSKYTKIVATLGPASNNKETLIGIINAGVDVVRMNFSHGDHSTHQANLNLVRKTAKILKKTVAVLQDLGGPKIRIGEFLDGKVVLEKGQTFTLTTNKIIGDVKQVYINYELLPAEVKKGDSIMIFDGKIHLSVQKTTTSDIVCKVVVGGEISNKKGVNVPGANLSISSLTLKDKEDVTFGIKNKVEFIALSFVRKASDVVELKQILNKAGSRAMVVAKIETVEAVQNIDEILSVSDAVMVARGDLAVEIGPENVPMIQKNIIKKANSLGKPVITATQMLDSMENSATPTRAEVSDVANAIFDGTDAIMLSGETAAGKYPVESVAVMTRIALATEHSRNKRQFVNLYDSSDVIDAVTLSVVRVSESINAKAIIALTESGLTARMISRFHAPYPIIAVSPVESSCNQLVLSYGVFPVKITLSKNIDVFTKQIKDFVLKEKIAKKGEKIVLSAGMPFGRVGSTNTLFVLSI